jgi:hypothetical protein
MSLSGLFLGQHIMIDSAGNFLAGSAVLKSNLTNAEIVEPSQLITRSYATEMKVNMDDDLLVERERIDALLLSADIDVDSLKELHDLSLSLQEGNDADHVTIEGLISSLDSKHNTDMTTESDKRDAEKSDYELKSFTDDTRFDNEVILRNNQKVTRDEEISDAKAVADEKTQLDDTRFSDEQTRVMALAADDNTRYDNEVIRVNQMKTDLENSISTHATSEMTARVTADEQLRIKINNDIYTENTRATLAEDNITTALNTEIGFTADRFSVEKTYTQGEFDELKGRCDLLEQQLTDLYDFFLDHDRFTKPIRSE